VVLLRGMWRMALAPLQPQLLAHVLRHLQSNKQMSLEWCCAGDAVHDACSWTVTAARACPRTCRERHTLVGAELPSCLLMTPSSLGGCT
jgi:hypothetical protein